MTKGDSLHLVAEFEGRIVAMCDARRDLSLKNGALTLQFGLTVAQDFRGEGWGGDSGSDDSVASRLH